MGKGNTESWAHCHLTREVKGALQNVNLASSALT